MVPAEGGENCPHAIAKLARRAVEAYVEEGRLLEPEALPMELPDRAGVFVTIREHGSLRGCVGTIEPTADTLAEEVVKSAVLAATDDPRFLPVRRRELPILSYEVSVLGEAERVEGLEGLDPQIYGVIVVSGRRRGLLLPGIPGLDTPEQQVGIARQKASIGPTEPVELYRFQTRHFE
jgi:MEMO1 family protein